MRHSAIIATALISGGVVAAVFIGVTGRPAGTPSNPSTGAPITSDGVGRGVPLATVTGPDGAPVRVPATLPEDCRHAYVRVAPALFTSREALKAILKGEARTAPRASLERANIALNGASGAPAVNAAVLDCGSQDIRTSTAYREARDAVRTASTAANLVGNRPLTPGAVTGFENDLAVIEYALAQL